MNERDPKHVTLPSAREDAFRAKPHADTPQTRSASYRLAFTDAEFLLREELRPVRLQLELLKPELELLARGIERTIVIFGSARIAEPVTAEARLQGAERAAADAPGDERLWRRASSSSAAAEAPGGGSAGIRDTGEVSGLESGP